MHRASVEQVVIYNDDNLKLLFARGLSFDQIGVELGVTRSTIAGEVKRMKLTRFTVRPNKNTISIKPRTPVEMTKSEMHDMLRKAVENTK